MNEQRFLNTLQKAPYKLSAYQILRERAIVASADYAEAHLSDAMIFEKRVNLWNYAAAAATLKDGMLVEFGVFRGKSINHFAGIFDPGVMHGFDSFEGLAEDWTGYHLPKGTFDRGGRLPKVRENVTLHKGWFDATVPPFLDANPGDIRFCHVDCDTFESALYVLRAIAARLKPGSIIVFDEYYGYPNWQQGEFKAWQTVCTESGIAYKYRAFADMQVAVEIEAVGASN